jgi:hypothetical protein
MGYPSGPAREPEQRGFRNDRAHQQADPLVADDGYQGVKGAGLFWNVKTNPVDPALSFAARRED